MARSKPRQPPGRGKNWEQIRARARGGRSWASDAADGFVRVACLGALADSPGLRTLVRPGIEAAIRSTVEEAARRCDDTEDNHVGGVIKRRILAMLERGADR